MEMVAKPAFAKIKAEQDLFFQLRSQVNQTVKILEPKRWFIIKLKAFLFPLLYIAAYAIALLYGNNLYVLYTCYFFFGCSIVFNFLNLIHDAVHNTLFRHKWINSLYVYFLDLLGANSYTWKVRHIRLHHNYPNVMGWDSDFEQSPMARIFPHGAYSRIHKYQHLYLPVLYLLFLFNWLLVRDFKDFFNRSSLVWKITTIPAKEYIKLFIFKAIYLFYILILPKLILAVTWPQMLGAFLTMMLTASIPSLIILLSPHATPESEFPIPDDKGHLPDTWFKHQLSTTNDVCNDNWLTRFFLGCFNYHIAHHLFPHIHHVYYPEITKVIIDFTKKNQLPYRTFSLKASLYNHYRLLKTNAMHDNVFEETM